MHVSIFVVILEPKLVANVLTGGVVVASLNFVRISSRLSRYKLVAL